MKQTILTAKQSQLLENLIIKYNRVVTTRQIYEQAENNWHYQQTKKLIARLVDNGWLIRIKRGLYAISNFSNRGFLSLSPYVVANLLVKNSYVSFGAALTYHGMFDQLTDILYSISKIQYKPVKLDSTEYNFIKVKDDFFFGWEKAEIDNQSAQIATAEKALIDMIQFHRSQHAVDLVIEKLMAYRSTLDINQIYRDLSHMSIVTIKIFGLIFDLLQIDAKPLSKLVETRQSTHWMMAGDKKFNAKWRLYYNPYFDQYKPQSTP